VIKIRNLKLAHMDSDPGMPVAAKSFSFSSLFLIIPICAVVDQESALVGDDTSGAKVSDEDPGFLSRKGSGADLNVSVWLKT
jgi:hypothetical protein